MPESPVISVSLPKPQVSGTQTDSPHSDSASTSNSHAQTHRCDHPQTVVAVLADSQSRAILGATADGTKSVADIVTDCQIATATAYRKVQRLTKTGLLQERIRICCDGPNVMEYQLAVDEVQITIDACGNPDVELSIPPLDDSQSTDEQDNSESGTSEKQTEPCSSTQTPFQHLFTELTGKSVLTYPQEAEQGRAVSDEEILPQSAQYLTDGLAETYPDMDPELFE